MGILQTSLPVIRYIHPKILLVETVPFFGNTGYARGPRDELLLDLVTDHNMVAIKKFICFGAD